MPRKPHFPRFGAMLLLIAALAFGVAACGDDSSSSDESSADAEPQAELADLKGEATDVTLDQGFLDALEKLQVTPGPVGDAEISSGGVASFPITGGNVTYYGPSSPVRPYVQGIIDHENSGLSLEAGDTKVELTDFVIDPGTSELTGNVSANGKEIVSDATLFDLDGSTLKPLESASDGSATLEGTTVLLSDDAAALLNDTFEIDALQGGLPVGTSSITVSG